MCFFLSSSFIINQKPLIIIIIQPIINTSHRRVFAWRPKNQKLATKIFQKMSKVRSLSLSLSLTQKNSRKINTQSFIDTCELQKWSWESQGKKMSICKKIAFQNFKGFSFSDASITLLMCFSLSFCPPALGFEKLERGETVRVACLKLNVYSMPTAFSAITSKKKLCSSLKIMELLSIFELPNSDYSSRIKL